LIEAQYDEQIFGELIRRGFDANTFASLPGLWLKITVGDPVLGDSKYAPHRHRFA
jgi:hypothetical protein